MNYSRAFSQVFRNKKAIAIRCVMAIFFALALGAIYSNTSDNQKSIQDRQGLLFAVVLNQTMGQ